ncbi:MAG TPA: sigma-70 family RNA polymerase sigma factor [Opitutaceae bacterium]|nr:sigma-70 family RNA polymerase sigma factor [Opitutaceae bacterium]
MSAICMVEVTHAPDDPIPDLLRRAQGGDEVAFGELMKGHYASVFRLVVSILRDEHAAQDVSQEVWLTVWRSLRGFRGDAKFSTWLHSIAVRRSIDHLRTRRRWLQRFLPFLSGDDESEGGGVRTPEPVAEGDPREQAERTEARQRFERALDALPPKHRAVLALREINGLSYDEIAKTLSIRRGTVMSRLFNARRMLAQKLGQLS